MGKLVLATRNEKKKREILEILEGAGFKIVTLRDFPYAPEVVEDGLTFKENAIKKSKVIADYTGCVTFADDSGLEVDALGGMPGVFSARFAGEPSDDERNNKKLLEMLKEVPAGKRTARFRCVIAIAFPDGRVETADGVCEGHIGSEPRGREGFGYDPLFIPENYQQTFGELSAETKNTLSHRGQALHRAAEILRSL